ncbi:MAG: class I SAM-dependent methyltransferase [bacterium]
MAAMFFNTAKRAFYSSAQLARIGWYGLHYFAGRRLAGPITRPGEAPYAAKSDDFDRAALIRHFRRLFQQEWQAIAKGQMKVPRELRQLPNPIDLLKDSQTYFKQADAVARRKYAHKGNREVKQHHYDKTYPNYYLQNFHYQSDGWLSRDSARIYDMQVEALFTGAAGAMRRQALIPIGQEITRLAARGRAPGDIELLDLACGTAPLLADVKDNFPKLNCTAYDLSPDYLAEARDKLRDYRAIDYIQGAAENITLADQSVDMVVTVYLFHELPPKIRQQVLAEIKRVLKPGGLYLNLDTIQYGDIKGLDILLETFPRAFYEPYYESYCNYNWRQEAAKYGFTVENENLGFLTKMTALRSSA